jgi:hypothetical protein
MTEPTFIQQCSTEQIACAKESFDFWGTTAKLGPQIAYGFLGNEQCECSFNGKLRGDLDSAGGLEQWHGSRREVILKGCGIDVWSAPHADQLKAALWELQNVESAALAKITAATTPAEAAGAVCEYLERAGEPGAVDERSAAADAWAAYGAANWGAAP